MSGKSHENLRQTSLLPLQLHKIKLALHGHSFYLNHTKITGNQFLITDNLEATALPLYSLFEGQTGVEPVTVTG